MLKNYFRIAYRNLVKYKVYSLVNIIGFSVALVPVVLSILYIFNEFSYDRYNKNFNRIYRVVREYKFYDRTIKSPINPGPLAAAMREALPEVKYAVNMQPGYGNISYKNQKYFEKNILYAGPDIFKIFTINMIEGNSKTALSDSYSILLSESMAYKFFGNTNPIGKTIKLKDVYYLTVTGVFEDLPVNSHFHADFIVPVSLISGPATFLGQSFNKNSWGFSMFFTYFMLNKNANPAKVLKKFPVFLKQYSDNSFFNKSKFYFQPLGDIHLHSHLQTEFENNGDIKLIYLYLSIALITLLIACINYVNLATARSSRRIKEIGIRKIIGAQRKQLIKQLLTETVLVTFTSLLITLVLVEFILPTFDSFAGRQIHFNVLENFNLVIWIIIFIIFISLAAGLYPAIFISSTKPISYFNNGTSKRSPKFSGALIVTQFLFSMILIYSTIVVREQLQYISHKDLGYNTKNIVVINLNGMTNSKIHTLKNEIKKYSSVINVCSSGGLPNHPIGSGGVDYPGKPKDYHLEISYSAVDYNYFNLYGLKIVKGRKFLKQYPSDENNAVIINETLANELGWKDPIGKQINYTSPNGSSLRTIIGVVKDFNTGSLYSRNKPYYFVMDPKESIYQISVKIKPRNLEATLAFLKKEVGKFEPEKPFSYDFFSDIINKSYNSVFKLNDIFSIFSIFTLFVACLGLFGMISFLTEMRKKEIGIRKVLGASAYKVSKLFISDIMKPIIFAGFMSLPLAYFIMNKWLENFAYRTSINFLPFAAAIFFVIIISLTVLCLQVIRAAMANPIESLRYE